MRRAWSHLAATLLALCCAACANFRSMWWSEIEPSAAQTTPGAAALKDQGAIFDELDRRCETAERDAQTSARFWSAALMAVTGTTCVTGLCSGATAALSTAAAAFPYQSVQFARPNIPAGINVDSAKVVPVLAAVIASLAAVSAGAVAAVFGILSASDRVNHYFGVMSKVRAARAAARRAWLGEDTREKALDQLATGCTGEMYREGSADKPANGKVNELVTALETQKRTLEAARDSATNEADRDAKTALIKKVDEALSRKALYAAHPASLSFDLKSLNAGTFGADPQQGTNAPVTAAPTSDRRGCRFTTQDFPTQIAHNTTGPNLQCRLPDGTTRYQVRAKGNVRVGQSGGAGGPGPYWIVLELRGGTCSYNDRRELVMGPTSGYGFDLMTTGCTTSDAIGSAQIWAARCTGGRDSTCELDKDFTVEVIPVQ